MNVGKVTVEDFNSRVNYLEQSKTRPYKVVLKDTEIYVSTKRMVKGNSKLVNILIFDLPAVKTCLNCGDCASTCYARKAQYQYTDTRVFRETNLELFNNHRVWLKDNLIKTLSKTKMSTVRLHSSGDFFSQEYIDFWSDIVKQFPKIKFYAYTKVEKILDFSKLESLSNFNLILSFINGKLNYGSHEYCYELQKKYDTFICPAMANSDVLCGRECTYCVTNKNVCFPIH